MFVVEGDGGRGNEVSVFVVWFGTARARYVASKPFEMSFHRMTRVLACALRQ